MREHVHWDGGVPEVRAAVAPWQHVRTIGEDVSATELLLPEGHRLRPVDLAAAAAAGHTTLERAARAARGRDPDRRRGARRSAASRRPGELARHELADARRPGARGGLRGRGVAVPARRSGADRRRGARRRGARRPRDRDRRARARGATTTPPRGRARPARCSSTASRSSPGTRSCSAWWTATPVLGAPGYPVSAALTFELFALPLLAALEGAAPVERPRARARLARRLASSLGTDDWVRVRLGRVGGGLVATPLPRGAGVLTSLVRADGLLVVPAGARGPRRRRGGRGRGCCATSTRSSARSSRSARTTRCSTSPPRCCARATRRRRSCRGPVGSLGGLVALRDGLCHVAGCHLLDPETGEYTLPWIERVMPGREVEVVRLVHREQGLIVAAGQPARRRAGSRTSRAAALREPPARRRHARAARPRARARAGSTRARVDGYEREEPTHLAVAAAVAAGPGRRRASA